MKTKLPAVFELASRSVDQSDNHCATEIDNKTSLGNINGFIMDGNHHVVMYCHKK